MYLTNSINTTTKFKYLERVSFLSEVICPKEIYALLIIYFALPEVRVMIYLLYKKLSHGILVFYFAQVTYHQTLERGQELVTVCVMKPAAGFFSAIIQSGHASPRSCL